MKTIDFGSRFKKSFKKVRSYPKFKKDKYETVLDCLVNNKPIPQSYDDHGAARHSPKQLKDKRIVHISPNICLIYRDDGNTLYLYDIGSHQDTGLTENI